MATAKKLPSGSWRCQVFSHYEYVTDETGRPLIDPKTGKQKTKRIYESFTSDDTSKQGKKESELMAAEFAMNKSRKSKPANLTLGEAIDEYITGLEPPISSITTITGYKKIRKYAFQSIMGVPLKSLDEKMINQAIVLESSRKSVRYGNGKKSDVEGKTISTKTVRNEYGLISAVLNIHRKDLNANEIKLPKTSSKIKELLSPEIIYSVVKDTEIELAVLLAMWLSFSASEICGLTKSKSLLDNYQYICIDEVVVYADGKEHRKSIAKTQSRKRVLKLPEHIKELIKSLPEDQDRLVNYNGHSLYDRFRRILKKNNLPHMTFHDLRHVNASIMAMLRVPDKYALERGGWKTDKVMKKVYTHTFSEEREKVDVTIDDYFENIFGFKNEDIDNKKYKAWLALYDKTDNNKSLNEFKEFMQHEMQHKIKTPSKH